MQESVSCVVSPEMQSLQVLVVFSAVVWMSGFILTVVCGQLKCLKMMKADYRMFKWLCQEANKWLSDILSVSVPFELAFCLVKGSWQW